MQVKFYSPLTADFFPNEPDYEDEFYYEYEGYPQDGHELLQYETAIRDAVENDTRDFGGDLMQYYHEDDSVRNKVVTAIPSVEVHGKRRSTFMLGFLSSWKGQTHIPFLPTRIP